MNAAQHFYVDDQNQLHFVWGGEDRKVLRREFYTYLCPTFASLAALTGTSQKSINLDAASDFLWTHAGYMFDLAAAAVTYSTQSVPNMSIQIIDTGAAKYLQDQLTPVPAIFGRPGEPFELPAPYLFRANSNIQVNAQNYDAAVSTGNLRLSFIGMRLYYAGAY